MNMFTRLSAFVIALGVFASPVVAAPDSAFIGPDGQVSVPLILHRGNGTHRVTFVGSCVVEFDKSFAATGNNGQCTAEKIAVAQEIVSRQQPSPYLTDIQVVRGTVPAKPAN
jgi:hypothetical protein